MPDLRVEPGDKALTGAGLCARRIDAEIGAPFAIWLLPVPYSIDPGLVACLDPGERARAARFADGFLHRRYLAAHGALRLLGETFVGLPAARQRYVANAFGKPCLAGEAEAHCSISYSAGWVLVAWSRAFAIGVDLEAVRPIEDAADLIACHCTAGEQARLAAAAMTDRDFLAVWVRKEACMKALGKGFAIAPSSFDCGAGSRPPSGCSIVEVEGKRVECGNYDLKGDLAVAWARLLLAG